MNVCVLGLGYIGLPTAALLALAGHDVAGFDTDARIRGRLRAGTVPAGEPAVRQIAECALECGRLRITDSVEPAQAYVICVPTPTVNARPVLRFVEEAAAAVASAAPSGCIVVLESTVPPGTTERLVDAALIAAGKAPGDVHLAHCPERVLPGATVREICANARVIGGRTMGDARIVRRLYASFCTGEISLTSIRAAEFCKVVENTYRDVNIAFANELAVLAEELGVDVWETIALANRHPRVDILTPGPGVGGHCIPVDPQFLSNANPLVTELIQSARRVNERMPYRIAQRLAGLAPQAGAKIALLGAAYKANVDDARESPTREIDALLRERGYVTAIFDPLVRSFDGPLCQTLEEAFDGADAAALLVAHDSFTEIDPRVAAARMRTRVMLDTRNVLDAGLWRACGFVCSVLGKPAQTRSRQEAFA